MFLTVIRNINSVTKSSRTLYQHKLATLSSSYVLRNFSVCNNAASSKVQSDVHLSKQDHSFLTESSLNNVTTITLKETKNDNEWNLEMMFSIRDTLKRLAEDQQTKAVILTSTGAQYSSGSNMSDAIKLMHPVKLHEMVAKNNASFYDAFIFFPKPLLVAVNGPAADTSLTSAALADAIIAVESATFSTTFYKEGVPPEGCSSVHFKRLMGEKNAERMLGEEAWIPTAREAKEAGLVQAVVTDENLMQTSQLIAERWISRNKIRWLIEKNCTDEYQQINRRESLDIAAALFGPSFLKKQYELFRKEGMRGRAAMFWLCYKFHPQRKEFERKIKREERMNNQTKESHVN